MSTATLTVRTDADLKRRVGAKLHQLGLTHSKAVNMFYHAIEANDGIPFTLDTPNATTKKAMDEAKDTYQMASFDSVDALFEDLEC